MALGEQQLLEGIHALLVENEASISLPLNKLNSGIAQLTEENSKIITRLMGKILRSISLRTRENDDALDTLGVHILAPLQTWEQENNLLLTQLAAKTGLTQPGDPLESALLNQVADAPELAYSATLLLAIREAMPMFQRIADALEEIRDRLPATPVRIAGEEEPGDDDDEPVQPAWTEPPPQTETAPVWKW
jgi:hypothetical protein